MYALFHLIPSDVGFPAAFRIGKSRRPILVRRHIKRGIGDEEICRSDHELKNFDRPVI